MDPKLKRLDLRTLALSTSDFLMPRVCLCCGRQLLPAEKHLCCVCLADLPLTHFEGMVHNPMADSFNSLVDAPGYERAFALFYYSGGFERITQALKYHRNFGAGSWFGRMLGDRVLGSGVAFDLVCPVPLHWTRRFTRGYNQAEIIGRAVAQTLSTAFEPGFLRRVRRTGSQVHFSAEDRLRNVSGAFQVTLEALRRWGSPAGTRPLEGVQTVEGSQASEGVLTVKGSPTVVSDRPLQILLIDDVFTTGATLAACAAALRDALGPDIRISIATLAYAG